MPMVSINLVMFSKELYGAIRVGYQNWIQLAAGVLLKLLCRWGAAARGVCADIKKGEKVAILFR